MKLNPTLALGAPVLAAVVGLVGLAPSATAATPATPVTGVYTLHYEWYSAPGFWQTTDFTLAADHTCTLAAGCTWKLSGTHLTLHFPNPRRGGVTYDGTVTPTGLNSPTSDGYMYFDTTGTQHEGLWYADKHS